jgi:hypothetical protein
VIALEPWPDNAIEHELRSLRGWLRRYNECPADVWVDMPKEGGFQRTALKLSTIATTVESQEHWFVPTRTLVVTYWGLDDEREARRVASWLTRVLARGWRDANHRAVIPVNDYSTSPATATAAVIYLVADTLTVANVTRDVNNNLTVPADVRYQVLYMGTPSFIEPDPDDPLPPGTPPPIEEILGRDETPSGGLIPFPPIQLP